MTEKMAIAVSSNRSIRRDMPTAVDNESSVPIDSFDLELRHEKSLLFFLFLTVELIPAVSKNSALNTLIVDDDFDQP